MAFKPTLKHIAETLQLSPSTISKALSGKAEVNEQTREQVLACAEKLGYRFNKQHLSEKSELRIAMVINCFDAIANQNTFFYDVFNAFHQHAAKLNIETILMSIQDEWRENPETCKDYFNSKNIDGIVIAGLMKDDAFIKYLESPFALPMVLLDSSINNPLAGRVSIDGISGVILGAEHLIELGHKKIGFLNGHAKADVSKERLIGFTAALGLYGLPFSYNLVYEGDFTEMCGEPAADYFIERGVSAVLCSSDLMAVGLIHGFQNKGLRIPQDISVVGFDNMGFCTLCTPKITTIAQERDRLGITACELLKQLIHKGQINRCLLPPSLVIRESTGKAPS